MSAPKGPFVALGLAAALGLVYWGWVIKLKPQRDKDKEDAKLLFKGLDAASTDEIVLRKKGSADVTLHKVDGQWRLVSPTAAPADQDAVTGLVSQLAGAKRNEIIAEKGADLHDFGLDDPSGAVTFRPSSPGAKAQVLFFGMDSPGGDQTYGLIDGQPAVFLTFLSVKNAVLKDAASLRDKTVWSFSPQDVEAVKDGVDGFSLTRGADGFWKVDAAARHEPGKGEQVDAWLGALSRLKADSVPSETGKGDFGLAGGKRIELTLKNGTKLTLVQGRSKAAAKGKTPAPPAGPTYVQLAGQGPVFQLSAASATPLGKKAQELMDLDVFKLQTGNVASFEVERPNGKLKAVKKAGVWAWDPPLEAKPGEKPFDFYGFLAGLANTQLLRRLDLKKDSPAKPQASLTFYGDKGELQEKCIFGPLRDGGQVAVSAMKNQAVVAVSNLLSALPPDIPRAAPAAATATAKVAPQPVPAAGKN